MSEQRQVNLNRIERLLSALGGILAIRAGLRRGSVTGMLVAAGGAAFVYRGLSGHSAIYKRLGVGTSKELLGGVTVRRAITVQRSPEETYRAIRDFAAVPHVFDRITSMRALGDGVYEWRIQEGPAVLKCFTEIVEDRRDEGFTWHTVEGSHIRCDGNVSLRVAAGDRGTEIHVTLHVAPPSATIGPLAPLLGRVARFQMGRELRRLQQYIETGEITTAGTRREHLELPRPRETLTTGPAQEVAR